MRKSEGTSAQIRQYQLSRSGPLRLAARLRRLRISGMVKDLFSLVAATAIGQSLPVLAAPLLTRLYTPEDFGVFAVYSSLIVVLGPVATLRYENAIPLPKADGIAIGILTLCFILVLCTALVTGAVLWVLHEGWLSASFLEPLLPWWWLVPLSVIALGFYQSLSQWAIRTKQFSALARTRVQQGVASVVVQLLLGVLASGPIGLLVGQAIGQSAGIGVLAQTFHRDFEMSHRLWKRLRPGKSRLLRIARRYYRFPLLSMPSAFLNSLVLSLPTFVLSAYYDPTSVGLYALTARVAGVPMSFVGRAVANIYVGETASMLRHNPNQFRPFFYSSIKRMAVVGIFGVGLPLLGARYVIPVVFGSEWADAGRLLQLLAPMYTMQFISSPFGGTLEVLERQDLFFLRELLRLALVGSALWLGASSGQPLAWTIGLLSAAGFVGYVIYIWIAKKAVEDWNQSKQLKR